jgi:hypothetical protein
MPLIQGAPLQFPAKAQSGNAIGTPSGLAGEFLISELLGRYSNLVKAGRVFSAWATLTAPVIYSTAAGTGGPLLWNRPNSNVDAHLLGVSYGALSTATSVANALGITGNGGQAVAPGSTTAIDATGNCLIGGPASGCTAYRIGTPTNAGGFFHPLVQVGTGAITIVTAQPSWIDLGGMFIIPPSAWGSVAAGATLTAGVLGVGLVWAELPA